MSETTHFWSVIPSVLALGGTAVLYWRLADRPLGASGLIRRVLSWENERERGRVAAERSQDPDGLREAMLAATLEEFGDAADDPEVAAYLAKMEAEREQPPVRPREVPPVEADLLFLVCVVLGSLLAGIADGSFAVRGQFDADFVRVIADGPAGWGALLFGGILVGLGTSLAGGCTSGHGLSGLGRLEKGSLVATATFFGTAVLVSHLLAARGGV